MLRKFMFVGLGGSGGKTLRYLRHELMSWLDTIGWRGDFPVGWQMLHIDTPTKQDGQEITDVKMLPSENYLGLVMDGVNFRTVSTRVDRAGGSDGWEDLAGWRVDPTFLQVPITTGAGQFRAVGRTVGLAYADKILGSLRACHQRLSSAGAGGELAEIHQLAYGSQASPPTEPVIVVVCSLAGGTGAGLLIDVCDLLRQLPGEAGENSFGVMYASDVFQQLGGLATSGVQPNTLAALSELMNGYWLTANYPRMSSILAAAGAPTPIGRSGPAFPFLVGAANTKGVSFGDQREVYAMIGRALRGWTADPTVQDRLVAYTMSNWQNSAQGNSVKAEVLMADHLPIFEAFGYSEVSLGTDRFRRYASERLGRDVARWLLEAHHIQALEADHDESREPDQIAEDIARDELMAFLDSVDLKERGDDDQVINAIRPVEHEDVLRGIASDIEAELTHHKALPSTVWVDHIDREVSAFAEQYRRDMQEAMRTRVEQWVDAVPDRLIKATFDMVSRYGLDTTSSLLEFVAEELLAVCGELNDEASEHQRWSEDQRSAISAKIPGGGNIPPTNHQVGDAVWEGLWVVCHFRLEASVRTAAQSLLTQLVNGVVRPLERSIRNARHELHQLGFEGDGVRDPVVETWPDRAVPDSMQPPKNEFLIIPPDEFPDRYDDLLRRSSRSDFSGPRHEVVRSEVISGDFLDEDEQAALHPVEVSQPWVADLPAIGITGRPQQPMHVRIRMRPDDLLRRSEAWILRPGSAFQRFLGQDLRSFLDDDPALDGSELSHRRGNLRRALTAAFDAAEPLVRLDIALFTLLHQKAEMPRRAVPSIIPFRDHPMEEDVREILASARGADQNESWDAAFTTSRKITSIAISSTLGAAHDPLVFASIMDPIVRGWNAAKQAPAARTNFWDNRRARPIAQFTPASHEVQLAMTRGWFTALMLGRLDREALEISRDGRRVHFPKMLLREPGNDRDRLAAVLESLGLAYAEVVNLKDLAPLAAYLELRDLGTQMGLANNKAAGTYENPNQTLLSWIRTGDTVGAIVKPVVEQFAQRDLTNAKAVERRDAAVELLQKVRTDYADRLEDYEGRATADPSLLGPNHWIWPGMWSLIEKALVDLRGAISTIELDERDVLM